jgi:hypothetical protein
VVRNTYTSPTTLTETAIWQRWQVDYPINARGSESGVSSRLGPNLFQNSDQFTNYFIMNYSQIIMSITQAFWDVISLRLLNNNRSFREAYCFHLLRLINPKLKDVISFATSVNMYLARYEVFTAMLTTLQVKFSGKLHNANCWTPKMKAQYSSETSRRHFAWRL